jgi:hypothetical protein
MLPCHIATVNDNVLARHVCRSVACHEDSNALEVVGFAPVAHGDTTRDEVKVRLELRLGSGILVDVRFDISADFDSLECRSDLSPWTVLPRRYAVDADASTSPFIAQRTSHLQHTAFARGVSRHVHSALHGCQ